MPFSSLGGGGQHLHAQERQRNQGRGPDLKNGQVVMWYPQQPWNLLEPNPPQLPQTTLCRLSWQTASWKTHS